MKCNGRGLLHISQCQNRLCNDGYIMEIKELAINIKQNAKSGDVVGVYEGLGEQGFTLNEISGDLIFNIHEIPHEIYKRKDNNLYITLQITFIESIIGKIENIKFFNNHNLEINTKGFGIINPTLEYIIYGYGLKDDKKLSLDAVRVNGQGSNGNLHIQFVIEYPTQITDEQYMLMKDVFSKIEFI